MKRGGWQEGPKRGTRRGKKEYKRLRKLQMMANRAKRIEDEAWELLDNATEDSVLGGSGDLAHSSDLREEVSDVYADPAYKEGDYVVILRDTRPGVSNNFSYDKEGKIMDVMDGEGASPNRYIVPIHLFAK